MMKRTVIISLACTMGTWAMGQVRHLKPQSITQMPKISLAEYNKLPDEMEEELTPQQLQKYGDLSIYEDLYSGKCSWYCGGIIDTVKASSCLKPIGKINYKGSNAHDFNHESVWAEGAPGQGIGEYLVYEFPGSCPRITTVKILNGYVKSEKAWRENSRPKAIKMYYMGKPYAILELEDSRTLQCFEVGLLGPHNEKAPEWTLKFEILEVYPGTKYEDTVISELFFDGVDVH